jgi:hypothetical protein
VKSITQKALSGDMRFLPGGAFLSSLVVKNGDEQKEYNSHISIR